MWRYTPVLILLILVGCSTPEAKEEQPAQVFTNDPPTRWDGAERKDVPKRPANEPPSGKAPEMSTAGNENLPSTLGGGAGTTGR
ncbi:MAG: hypothetical protein ACAH95_10705 [Fimbriimonas sp.]